MNEHALTVDAREAKGLHDGSITMVVRVVDPQPDVDKRRHRWGMALGSDGVLTWGKAPWLKTDPHNYIEEGRAVSPFGVVGDRLWVREEWYYDILGMTAGFPITPPAKYDPRAMYYRADGECCQQIPECCCGEVGPTPWRAPAEMFPWASRTLLDVTDVRVVRLRDVGEADAIASGIAPLEPDDVPGGAICTGGVEIGRFRALFAATLRDANPWLWLATVAKVEDK